MSPAGLAWRHPRAPRGLGVAVLALHLAALLLLHEASRQPPAPTGSAPRLSLRWITEPAPAATAPAPPPAAQEADEAERRRLPPERARASADRPATDTRPALPAPAAAPQPISAGLSLAPAPAQSPAQSPAPAASAASAPASAAPLRLDLPRQGLPGLRAQDTPARQARSDPRSNSAATGPADPLERALEGGPARLTEEDLGSGRRRIRLGRDCVELRESRAAGLDPFQSATRPAPKLAETCR